jgi:uncharacterized protein YndB with AHSA1/START domain/DNA-binding transcriptional ArsR family regulator
MDASVLAALAEPNRLRIVELLGAAPRSVGEIAATLDLRQPQVTKHLQALGRAGLVTVHPLGQRRIYALRREALQAVAGWAERFATAHPSEDVLEQYRAAIEAEQALLRHEGARAARTLRLERDLPAPPAAVWRAWTTAESVRRWWSPAHFTVADCTVSPVAGGPLRIVMQEGDGTQHVAEGRFLELTPPSALRFELAPLGPDGAPLFSAVQDVRLAERDGGTALSLSTRVFEPRPEAAPALAGMRPGWEQLLDKLAAEVAATRR